MTVRRGRALPVPPPEAHLLDGLRKHLKHLRAGPSLWVDAEPFEDDTDPAVFGAAFAVQIVDGEPWLIRGVLKRRAAGRPILCRVTIEHYKGQEREVTGPVIRDINVGTIRSVAFVRLREKAGSRALLAQAGVIPAEVAQAARTAAVEAAKGGLARGPHGGYRPEHYRAVAVRRLELDAEGRDGVLDVLCAEWSELLGERVVRDRMHDWLKKATAMEFLAPGKPGVKTRRPGPNLYQKEEGSG
jgi:hypothetical protein